VGMAQHATPMFDDVIDATHVRTVERARATE
jgi:hypothetical protein